MALEGRRLDKLEEVVGRSASASAAEGVRTLKYALRCCQDLVINRAFRQQVRGGRKRWWRGVRGGQHGAAGRAR